MMAGTLYLALMGAEGLERVAAAVHGSAPSSSHACSPRSRVCAALFGRPGFHEAVLALDRPVAPVLAALAQRGIEGGLDLLDHYPELGPALLVCATETRSSADIDAYAPRAWRSAAPGAGRPDGHDIQALREKLIFEYSRPGRGARAQWPAARRCAGRVPAGAAAAAASRCCPRSASSMWCATTPGCRS